MCAPLSVLVFVLGRDDTVFGNVQLCLEENGIKSDWEAARALYKVLEPAVMHPDCSLQCTRAGRCNAHGLVTGCYNARGRVTSQHTDGGGA
eukprot:866662-Rhodomonas_salina.2